MAGENLNEKQFRSYIIEELAQIRALMETYNFILVGSIEKQRNIVSMKSVFPVEDAEKLTQKRKMEIIISLEKRYQSK